MLDIEIADKEIQGSETLYTLIVNHEGIRYTLCVLKDDKGTWHADKTVTYTIGEDLEEMEAPDNWRGIAIVLCAKKG